MAQTVIRCGTETCLILMKQVPDRVIMCTTGVGQRAEGRQHIRIEELVGYLCPEIRQFHADPMFHPEEVHECSSRN